MSKNTKSEAIKAFPAEDVEVISLAGVDKKEIIPIENIIEYVNKGLTLSQIAKLCGCSRQNVHQRLQAVAYDKAGLENFKRHRGDVFAFIQSKLLNSIDDQAIKSMSAAQRVVCTGILYDKERIERGLSTENISIAEINLSLEQIGKRKEELLRQIGVDVFNSDKGEMKSNSDQIKSEEIKTDKKK